jgi:hypothetical protein
MKVRLWLARLAGARLDVLDRAPGDVARYATMGGVLVSTAAVAGVSAFFALNSVLSLSWPLAAVVGLGWAVLILNLDRLLVVSMSNAGSLRRNVTMALPRLLLALVMGTVVSTPLVLRIFEQEINAELTTMKAEQVQQSKKALDQAYANIAELQKTEKSLQDAIAGRTSRAVSDDPDVKAAQSAYDNADKAYQEADRQAQCELDGTCGTGQRGVGESYRQKRAAADSARQARDDARRKLDDATAKAGNRIQDGTANDVAAARAKLPDVQSDLAAEEARRRSAEAAAAEAADENSGLLARLEALSRITDNHPSGEWAHVLLFLLFLAIEVLPVLVKMLAALGPQTLYDRLVEEQDTELADASRRRADEVRKLAEANAETRMALAQQQLDAQVKAGREAVAAMVERQAKIALNAIRTWGDLAELRSDEELDRWLRANTRTERTRQPQDVTVPESLAERTIEIPRVAFHRAPNVNNYGRR